MFRSRSVTLALLTAAACALFATASCSEDGVTTSCPPLPLYQTYALGDASPPDAMTGDSGASQQALDAAIAARCATGPSGKGSGSTAGGASGVGGSAGKAGSGGSAGKGGASSGGTSSVDSAGAAGRD